LWQELLLKLSERCHHSLKGVDCRLTSSANS
jgi:hypothetical protein